MKKTKISSLGENRRASDVIEQGVIKKVSRRRPRQLVGGFTRWPGNVKIRDLLHGARDPCGIARGLVPKGGTCHFR